jgi:hypothetical protein
MANAVTIQDPADVRVTEREKLIRYNIRLSGNYVQHVRGQNVGEVIDLSKVVGINQYDQFWGQKGPRKVYIINVGESGYGFSIVPGADALHWLLVVYSGVATELAAGAYPAPLLADLDITIEAAGLSFN